MKKYCMLVFVMLFLTSCVGFLGSDNAADYSATPSLPLGHGDLDTQRKSGAYYTKLNANRNKHLPTAKPYRVRGETYVPYASAHGFEEIGIASWYGPGFHGKLTANGEKYNQNSITAAHKLLPFGTKIRVTNLENGRTVVVRINDRGPFLHDRIIDLSKGAAKQVGILDSGTAKVHLSVEGAGNNLNNFTPQNVNSQSARTNDDGFFAGIGNSISDFTTSVGDFFTGRTRNSATVASGTGSAMTVAGGYSADSTGYVNNLDGNFGLPAGEINRFGQPVSSAYTSAYGSRANTVEGTINRFGTVGGSSSALSGASQSSYSNLSQTTSQSNGGVDLETKSDFYTTNPNDFGDDPTYYSEGDTNSQNYTSQNYSSQTASMQNLERQNTLPPSQNTVSQANYVTETMMHSQNSIPEPYSQNTNSSATQSAIPDPYATNSVVRHTTQGVGMYYVQVAVLHDQKIAQNAKKVLEREGLQVEIVQNAGQYFIQVGPYSHNANALQVRNQLRSEFPRAIMITR